MTAAFPLDSPLEFAGEKRPSGDAGAPLKNLKDRALIAGEAVHAVVICHLSPDIIERPTKWRLDGQRLGIEMNTLFSANSRRARAEPKEIVPDDVRSIAGIDIHHGPWSSNVALL